MLARNVWPTRLVWESTDSIMRITRLVPAGSVPLAATAGAEGGADESGRSTLSGVRGAGSGVRRRTGRAGAVGGAVGVGGGVGIRTRVGPSQGGPVTGIGTRTRGGPSEGGPAGRSAGVPVRAFVRVAAKLDAQDVGDVDGAHVDAVVDAHGAGGAAEIRPVDHAAVLQCDGVGECERGTE